MIIDPFAGTCSSGVSALRSGSFFIGCDFEGDVQVCSANHWWLLSFFYNAWTVAGHRDQLVGFASEERGPGFNLEGNVTYELCVSTEVCVHNHCDFCIHVRIGPG